MRELKTPEQLVMEGYNAEGALVFLKSWLQEEKERQYNLLMTCPADQMQERRAVLKYINSIESVLMEKIRTGILRATEQVEINTRQED